MKSSSVEIGGFFGFPRFDCKRHPKSVFYYLTSIYEKGNHSFFRDGRGAIKSVLLNIDKLKDKTCYLPAYLCHSIAQPFEELNLNVKFYSFKHPLKPVLNDDIEDSLIFIIDYFGTEFISNEEIVGFLDKRNIVVLDITHSILNKGRFKMKHENLYLVSSLRKIFPIPDGGVLYYINPDFRINKGFPKGYENMLEVMASKSIRLEKRHQLIYESYETNKDDTLIQLQEMPFISQCILENINISDIIIKRNKNLDFMYKNISQKEHLLFNHSDIKSPFILPLVLESEKKRDVVKNILIKNKIYPPVHWGLPSAVLQDYLYEHELSKKILSIPIDQRYDNKNLLKVTNILNSSNL